MVVGIRRCGKSVLSHQLVKNNVFAHVNFDDEKLANLRVDDRGRWFGAFLVGLSERLAERLLLNLLLVVHPQPDLDEESER